MTSYLYSVRKGDYIKIGFSTNPSVRFSTGFNVRLPDGVKRVPLSDMRVVHGTRDDEAELHGRLFEFSVGNEWYREECLLSKPYADVFLTRPLVASDDLPGKNLNIAVPVAWHRWLKLESASRNIQMNALLLIALRHFRSTGEKKS